MSAASAYTRPYVIQCLELAMQRSSAAVYGGLKRRVTSLAMISATASFFGLFGVVLGIMNSFESMGTSQSTGLARVANHISEAMVPGILGLGVAMMAFWFYRTLTEKLKVFDGEMKSASVDLANRLVCSHPQIENHGSGAWGCTVQRITAGWYESGHDRIQELGSPNLSIGRMYGNGLLQLVWPRQGSEIDRSVILGAAAWVCVAYGVIGFLALWFQQRSFGALTMFAFFAAAGWGVKNGSRQALISVCGFFFVAAGACYFSYGMDIVPLCLVLAPLPLVGSLRAVCWPGTASHRSSVAVVLQRVLLAVLTLGVVTAVLFGTFLGLYQMHPEDKSMQPTVGPGDWLVGVTAPSATPIERAELWQGYTGRGNLTTMRVIGLPGDRVDIKAGQLMLNGAMIPEPYCNFYWDAIGDFPVASTDYADDYYRWCHQSAYHGKLTAKNYLYRSARQILRP